MSDNLKLKVDVVPAVALSPTLKEQVITLCERAYEEEVRALFSTFHEATHVMGFVEEKLVSHAMWVTRWLQPGDNAPLRTAYVEMVATNPLFQRHGFASKVMQHLEEAVTEWELAALSPADTTLYVRRGWRFWRGPLFIRKGGSLLPTPDEQVMILPLPRTPPLDLALPLSAEWREGEWW